MIVKKVANIRGYVPYSDPHLRTSYSKVELILNSAIFNNLPGSKSDKTTCTIPGGELRPYRPRCRQIPDSEVMLVFPKTDREIILRARRSSQFPPPEIPESNRTPAWLLNKKMYVGLPCTRNHLNFVTSYIQAVEIKYQSLQ